MAFKYLRFIAILFLLLPLLAQAGDIKLPAKLPKVHTTPEASLGTLDKEFGVSVGSRVDDFTIKNHTGNTVSFGDLKKQAPLLVIFYRGGWCPYCNRQIRELTENWPEFEKRKVLPVLISVDKPDAAALALRTYEIPFPVLSDPDLTAHTRFNVAMQVSDTLAKKYKSYGIVLEDWSDNGHHKIAVASAFLVDKEGKVLWAHSDTDYKTRPSSRQLLAVIDQTLP